MKIFVVIPTIRSLSFLDAWGEEFKTCNLIIVEDHKTREISAPAGGFRQTHHYSWSDIHADFGEDEWIFSRQNAGIRSYGFWKAHTLGADVVITLDDDCYPSDKHFVKQHLDNLSSRAPEAWFPTFPHPEYMYARGYPYDVRNKHRVVVSHGLWSNKMDMDAKTQLRIGDVNISAYPPTRQYVPFGYFFPMSSMNLAFTREALPLMYFPLMGKDPQGKPWGYDRYDDIWAGVFAKKILDHLGLAVVNGSPFVEHKKASDPSVNLQKEQAGMKENEDMWKRTAAIRLTGDTVTACYEEIAEVVVSWNTPYFTALGSAMRAWIRLFDSSE